VPTESAEEGEGPQGAAAMIALSKKSGLPLGVLPSRAKAAHDTGESWRPTTHGILAFVGVFEESRLCGGIVKRVDQGHHLTSLAYTRLYVSTWAN
jgi:hypothetical protein